MIALNSRCQDRNGVMNGLRTLEKPMIYGNETRAVKNNLYSTIRECTIYIYIYIVRSA